MILHGVCIKARNPSGSEEIRHRLSHALSPYTIPTLKHSGEGAHRRISMCAQFVASQERRLGAIIAAIHLNTQKTKLKKKVL